MITEIDFWERFYGEIPSPVYIADNQRRCHYANSAMTLLAGLPTSGIYIVRLERLLAEGQQEQFAKSWSSLLEEKTSHGTLEIAHGEELMRVDYAMRANIVPFRHLLTFRDRAALDRARFEGVRLAARTAAQHLKAALSLIAGYNELIITRELKPEQLKAFANQAREGALGASNMLDRLLGVSPDFQVTHPNLGLGVEEIIDLERSTQDQPKT